MSGEEADYMADGGYNPTDMTYTSDPTDDQAGYDRYVDDGVEDLDDRESAGYYDDHDNDHFDTREEQRGER